MEATSDEENLCYDHSLRLDVETSSHRASKYVSSLSDLNNPATSVCREQVAGDTQLMLSDMTLFLMRKQLLPERFSNFDDTPESYTAWKSSFKNIIGELKVSNI